ncbi:hypothetical protein SLS56_006300 [Neofusicoccum ribis]|uniref:Uncharacterized protein n=1 Tax=Neofusicoccum ribis TaxID=45134 RepID=A0ABR3SRR9_9PEZI
MAYVPPALRKKQQEACDKPAQPLRSSDVHRERLPRVEDVHDHYWPLESEADEGMRFTIHSTLNSAAASPDTLKYIMLFKDANPRWQTDHIIYVKTSLHMLPGSEKFTNLTTSSEQHARSDIDTAESVDRAKADAAGKDDGKTDLDLSEYQLEPVAVFEQVAAGQAASFRFAGYHKIERLQYIEPRSADLVRMLDQKFSIPDRFSRVKTQQRSPESWKRSLEHRWAVIELKKDEEAAKNLPAPDVKIADVREKRNAGKEKTPQKSVNEMLKEMRLGKSDANNVAESRPPWT